MDRPAGTEIFAKQLHRDLSDDFQSECSTDFACRTFDDCLQMFMRKLTELHLGRCTTEPGVCLLKVGSAEELGEGGVLCDVGLC